MVLTPSTKQPKPVEKVVREGGPQGGPSDGPPQPPAPNTNLVLSSPELLPPFRESEVGDGWSSSGKESDKEAGRAVAGKRGREVGKKTGETMQRNKEETIT